MKLFITIFAICLILIVIKSCQIKNIELKTNQINLNSINTYSELVNRIDSLICIEDIEKPIQLVADKWKLNINNYCKKNIKVDRISCQITNATKFDYPIQIKDSDEKIRNRIETFLFNPKKLSNLAITPLSGQFDVRMTNETTILEFITHMKRINFIYKQIPNLDNPIKVSIERLIPSPTFEN